MSSSLLERPPLSEGAQAKAARDAWAEWSKARNSSRRNQGVAVFRKEGEPDEVLVYDYGNQCAVISRVCGRKRFTNFRPWYQPFATVARKLKRLGWRLSGSNQQSAKREDKKERQHAPA
jgi:hypothetical protein